MNCPACGKVLAFTKPLMPSDDAVTCRYCYKVVPAEQLVWSDGQFHFDILGDVPVEKISPKVIMRNQRAKILDLGKIHSKALRYIQAEPNLRAICGEFGITSANIRIVLLSEETK